MERRAENFLSDWLAKKNRKPLIIRGARQVGKTWLVRHIQHPQYQKIVELNFEKRPGYKSLFDPNDPKAIVRNIEVALNITIDPASSILFLDEVQVFPELLSKLRWFYEDYPQLPVIAAGSLLEFIFGDHDFSMPVGRVDYMYLEPLSFEEFLIANDQEKLSDYLQNFNLSTSIPDFIHHQLMKLVKEYIFVGGLPEAMSNWIEFRDSKQVSEIHHSLLATYRDDFSKYTGRMSTDQLEDILHSTPRQLGDKFVYRRVNPEERSSSLKRAFNLLCKARLCHRVSCTAANGLPLGSEIKDRVYKAILIDCGLVSALLHLDLSDFGEFDDLKLSNNGALSEQLVGQLLRTLAPQYIDPKLYYWVREKKASEAEIDYLIQHKKYIIPVEVKSGKTGTLKSLHYFMGKKKLQYAVRVNGGYPSLMDVDVKTTTGDRTKYKLLSIPFYLMEQVHRLLGDMSL